MGRYDRPSWGSPHGPPLGFQPRELTWHDRAAPAIIQCRHVGAQPRVNAWRGRTRGSTPVTPRHFQQKSRKSAEPRPRSGLSPTKDPNHPNKKLKLKSSNNLPQNSGSVSTNNNYGDLDDDGGGSLKIDEDRIDGSDLGPGKENLENKNMDSDRDQDSI